jgi:hypothetical protein
MFAAIRRASSSLSNLAADLRPGSFSKYRRNSTPDRSRTTKKLPIQFF